MCCSKHNQKGNDVFLVKGARNAQYFFYYISGSLNIGCDSVDKM